MTRASAPLAWLSPTDYNALRRCALQVAFKHGRQGSGRPLQGAAARLGSICHGVLEDLARSGAITADVPSARIADLWDRRVAEADIQANTPSPETWPDYQLLRAQLPIVVRRVAALVQTAGAGAAVRPEVHLVGAGGRLHGYADLIVDGDLRHLCIDYKTGRVFEPLDGTLRDDITAQLELYAALEYDTSGRWPSAVVAVPFGAPPIDIEVRPDKCTARSQEALALLHAYNAIAPGPQPGAPDPVTCRFCDFSAQCSDFWAACPGWAEVYAVRGRICEATPLLRGGVVLLIECDGGSLTEGSVRVRCSDPSRCEQASDDWAGRYLRAAFLRKERLSGIYDVTSSTRLSIAT